VASRVLAPALTVTPVAGRSFLNHLRALILRYGRYRPPNADPTFTSNESANEERLPRDVPADVLTRDLLEDIRIRGCFVAASDKPATERSDESVQGPPATTAPADLVLDELARRYSSASTIADATFRCRVPADNQGRRASGTLIVPGWVRERAAEIFFEKGDEDRRSIVEALLETLLQVSVIMEAKVRIHLTLCSTTRSGAGGPPR
jgi:actin-related protein 10